MPPSLVNMGRAYLLNRLPDLTDSGVVDEVTAERISAVITAELAGTATPTPGAAPVAVQSRPVAPTGPVAVYPAARVPTPAAPPGPSFAETFFTPERAPSLLLYLGAFLVVVAALIFVNVSGQQISDSIRLVLMVVGTLAFLGAGLACHRIPRVEEAGPTFLIVGALLVPLDFAAYYALVVHISPFTSPAMWVLGSLVAGGLYAALTITGYGRAYSYLFFVASLSALAGTSVLLDLSSEWFLVPFATYALVLQLATRLGETRSLRVVAPLELPGRILMFAALFFGTVPTVISSSFFALPFPERLSVAALALLGTAYFVARTDRDRPRERWLAVAGPAAIVFAALFAIGAPLQTYGFVSGVLAVAYALVREVSDLADVPSPFPQWARYRARFVGYALIAGAVLPLAAYWRSPLVGATTELAMTVLVGWLAVLRTRSIAQERAVADLSGFVGVAAAALHLGVLFLLLTTGLTRSGTAPFSGMEPRVLALGFTPVAAGLGVLAAVALRRLAILANLVSAAALVSAALVIALAFGDAPLAAFLATAATVGAVAASVDARRPSRLWIAAAFAGVAAVAFGRWLQPPEEIRPLGPALAALVLFIPAYLPRFREHAFARVAREIAIAAALAGVGVGLGFALARPLSVVVWDTPIWLATSPAFSVFGGLALIEALHRRSERIALFATASFLASVLIVVARLHPVAIEAFTVPAAIYLGLAAWGIARYGSPALRADLGLPALLAAAVALVGPTYLWSWGQDAATRTLVVLAESVILLRFASARGLRELAAVSIGTLALVVVRAAAAPLALEAYPGVFGLVTLGLVLMAPRIKWHVGDELREAAEVVGVLLLLAAPLVRARAFEADALAHGATVLVGSVVIIALGLWSGRRAVVATAATMLAAMATLALADAARAEPYVTASGVVLLALVLAIPRYLPRRLPAHYERALEILAVAVIVSSGTEQMLNARAGGGDGPAARVLAESIAMLAVGLAFSRRALATAGLGAVALVGVWILGDPTARQFHGIAGGAALVALSLAAVRYAPRVLTEQALIGGELLGAALFLGPTLLASWTSQFVPGTIIVFFQVALLLGVGIVMRRRWLVLGALAVLGLETVRATIDVVNRLPNWALFGGSGAILLTAGFVLLIKREAWNAWSRNVYAWWARL
ncbi:MAG: hypothetical protein AABM32_06420 [Chloroflexota bacterium]